MKTLFFFSSDKKSCKPEVFTQLTVSEMMLIRGGDTSTDGTDANGTKVPE